MFKRPKGTEAYMQEQEAQPGIFGGILERYADEFWLLFRVIFAILVFLHGIQKAFLLWGFPAGANPGGLGALLDIAGWVELISALLIGFGILTRTRRGRDMRNHDCRLLWHTCAA